MSTPTPDGAFLALHGVALLDNGYEIVPIQPGSKAPGIDDWQTNRVTRERLTGLLATRHRRSGVGILTKHTPAVDIDVRDEVIAAYMVEWIKDHISSEAPLRIGEHPKSLLLFQTDAPFRKVMSARYRKPDDAPDAKAHRIEVLGLGQQFVAFHIHPDTGKPYTWPSGDSPLSVPALDLPTLTLEDAQAICREFERVVEQSGWEKIGAGSAGDLANTTSDVADKLAEDAPPPETDEEVERVKAALEHLEAKSSDLDYDQYRNVLFSLKWLKWSCGEALARKFSESSSKHVGKTFNVIWRGAEKQSRANAVTIGTLFDMAKRAGWDATRKRTLKEEQSAFDALMDEIEFLVEDDGDGATKLLNKIVEADLSTLSEERLIKAIKDQTKIALGALRKAAKVAREPADKPTHANYALALLKELKAQGDVPAVGVEGKLWKYAPDRGVWVGRLTSDYEVEVAQHFDGKENCNRRSDYVAIATHAYAIASEDEEDFFNDAPIGLACEKRFYRVTDENEIVRDKLSADHRQRVLSPVRPITGDMPIFRAFMADTFRGDGNTEQIDLLQEVMGAVALGTMARHEKVLLLKGPGRSGKSTIAKIIEHLVPSDARSAVSPFKWDSEYYLANMAGKRLNVVGELPDDEAIPASHFKSVTGRDMLTGRHPTHRPFNFRNTAAHIFNANHYVFTKDHSEAFYARWILMDFRNSRLGTDETINVNLAEQIIRDELPAIMAWALQGAKRLQERGNFPTTKAHNRLMDQWRRRTSTLMEFLQDDDECLLGKGDQFSVRRSNFYEAYSRWCRDSNRRPLGKQRLYDEIETPQVAALGVKFSKLAGNSVLLRGVLIKTVDFLAAYKQADSDEL